MKWKRTLTYIQRTYQSRIDIYRYYWHFKLKKKEENFSFCGLGEVFFFVKYIGHLKRLSHSIHTFVVCTVINVVYLAIGNQRTSERERATDIKFIACIYFDESKSETRQKCTHNQSNFGICLV